MPQESEPENHLPLTEKEIFLHALEIDDPGERSSWVSEACASDDELRANVEALLASADTVYSPLEPNLDLLSSGLREMADAATPQIGSSITYFGDYELLDEIARGAMGIVFRARQTSLNRIVAVKMIRGAMLSSESEVRRFKVESEAAASLDHPNIVPIYEVGEQDDQHYFSMKFIEGGTLADHLAKFGKDPRAAARLLATVARAIQEAHQRGILHRDLKPGNILLDDQDRPHITDFGLAKQLGSESGLTHSGQLMGTPFYMSPEQAAGDTGKLSTAADIYSLGAILFELLAGRPPFHGDSLLETLRMAREDSVPRLSSIAPAGNTIDRDLETIVTKCLQKTPAARYSSAGALADDLESWLEGRPIAARPIALLERTFKWIKRKPVAASLIGVAALLLLTLGVGGPIAAYKQNELRLLAQANSELAQENAKEADRASKRLELENYRFSIQLAKSRLGTDEAITVPQLLWETKPELRSWEWGHLMAQCQIEEWAVIAGNDPVRKIDISPDGGRFATITKHSVSLWDAVLVKKLWQKSYQEKLYDVALHPRGDYVAVVRGTPGVNSTQQPLELEGMRSQIVIHSGDTGQEAYVFGPDYHPHIAFGVDGNSFYTHTIDETAEVVHATDRNYSIQDVNPAYLHRFTSGDWAAAKATIDLPPHFAGGIRRIRVDPGGKWLGVRIRWNQFAIYDALTLDHVRTINPDLNNGAADIAFDSEQGRVLQSFHNMVIETKLEGGDPTTSKREFKVNHDDGLIGGLALLPGDNSHLALSQEGVTVVLDGKVERMIRQGDTCTSLVALAGNRCLIGDSRGVIRCWKWDAKIRPKPAYRYLKGAEGQHVELHPDGQQVLFRDYSRDKIFQAKVFPTGDKIQEPLTNLTYANRKHHIMGNIRLANLLPKFAPSGEMVCRSETGLVFADSIGGSARLLGTPFTPFDAVFDGDGDWIVISGEDGSLAAIHQPTGRVVTAKFTASGACRIDLSNDGTLAIAHVPNQYIYGWSPQTGDCVFKRSVNASCAALHPDGIIVAAGDHYGQILLIDPRDGKTRRTLISGQRGLWSIGFSSDGLRIGSSGSGFKLWDWQLGESLISFKTTANSRDLAFSPDGLSLAYTSMNPTLEVRMALPWQYDLGDPEFYQAVEKLFGTK